MPSWRAARSSGAGRRAGPHQCAPALRHPKRYQDVEELLDDGIDVYTTLNIQHLESLNDVVPQITGVTVHETVPDRVFDEADEIELVDLPPDELLSRLQRGKVYVPDQAARADPPVFPQGQPDRAARDRLRRAADRVDEPDARLHGSQGHPRPLAGQGAHPGGGQLAPGERAAGARPRAAWRMT